MLKDAGLTDDIITNLMYVNALGLVDAANRNAARALVTQRRSYQNIIHLCIIQIQTKGFDARLASQLLFPYCLSHGIGRRGS